MATIEPGSAALVLAGRAPVVVRARVVTPTAGALLLTGGVPGVLLGIAGPAGGAHAPRGGAGFQYWRNPPSVWWGMIGEEDMWL